MEYWTEQAGEVAGKSGFVPILQNKRNPKRKKHFQTFQPVSLLSKEIIMTKEIVMSI